MNSPLRVSAQLAWDPCCSVCETMGAIEWLGTYSPDRVPHYRCEACGALWEGAELGRNGRAALASVGTEVPLADVIQLAAPGAEPIAAPAVGHGDVREAEAVEPVPADTLVTDGALHVMPARRGE